MDLYDELMEIVIDSEEDLEKFKEKLEEYGITDFDIQGDCAFDSPGLDVYYYAVAYIYEGKLELITGEYECC